jgi:hypothetical protein
MRTELIFQQTLLLDRRDAFTEHPGTDNIHIDQVPDRAGFAGWASRPPAPYHLYETF